MKSLDTLNARITPPEILEKAKEAVLTEIRASRGQYSQYTEITEAVDRQNQKDFDFLFKKFLAIEVMRQKIQAAFIEILQNLLPNSKKDFGHIAEMLVTANNDAVPTHMLDMLAKLDTNNLAEAVLRAFGLQIAQKDMEIVWPLLQNRTRNKSHYIGS